MPLSEAKKKSNKKWNDKNLKEIYDRIQIVVPKGTREKVQENAKEKGESVGHYIKRAVDRLSIDETGVGIFGIIESDNNK